MAKSMEVEQGDKNLGNIIKLVGGGILIIVVLGILFGAVVTVPAGSRGVLLEFGNAKAILPEGLSFKIPFIQDARIMSVQTQKYEIDAFAASKDLQDVKTKIALNFHIEPAQTMTIYRNIGENYGERIIAPAVQESVKAATAQYTAEELITRREAVKDKLETVLQQRLITYGIQTDALSITNFEFSAEFTGAIEQKVVSEQQALQAKNTLERVKYEAQQKIEEAKGKAESMRIQNEQLEKSDKVLYAMWIEKWDGKTPTVIGGQSPSILMSMATGNVATNMNTTG